MENISKWILFVLSSCGVDPSQTYENQEPLERSRSEKELNETFSPLDTPRDKLPLTPVIAEKNNSIQKSDEIKNQIHEEIIAESNFLDKNVTERLKERERDGRRKREVRDNNEALLRSSSEEMIIEQSEEIDATECDTVTLGIISKTHTNTSVFSERVCVHVLQNYTYTIPLSHCLQQKQVDVVFRSSRLKEIRLCDLHCKYDTLKNCQMNREISKPVPSGGHWTSRVTLQCNMDRWMKIRAGFMPLRDLCYLNPDSKIPFVEFNIHIYRDCRN